jgi:hypothetical protein
MALTPDQKFWPKVKVGPNPHPERVEGDCWVWKAFKDDDGYGLFVIVSGWTVRAHRWSFCRANGYDFDQFKGEVLDHKCKNRACVRPSHLEHVTAKVNAERSEGAEKTHCVRGHLYTPETTRWKKNGTRSCKVCHAEDERSARAAGRRKKALERARERKGI